MCVLLLVSRWVPIYGQPLSMLRHSAQYTVRLYTRTWLDCSTGHHSSRWAMGYGCVAVSEGYQTSGERSTITQPAHGRPYTGSARMGVCGAASCMHACMHGTSNDAWRWAQAPTSCWATTAALGLFPNARHCIQDPSMDAGTASAAEMRGTGGDAASAPKC